MSWSIAFRRSPNAGAFTATACSVPRSLFTTSVASASPSTSSAMTSRGLLTCAMRSSAGRRSLTALIFLSVIRMYASSRMASIFSGSVTMSGEM